MSKVLTIIAAIALAAIAAVPAQAEIICDDDGCRPAIIIHTPILLGDDD